KTSKLTAVIISFYFMSVCCQFTSSTIFLQSFLQLSIVLASLPVQPVVKLGFDPLVLPTCRSQFRGLVTIAMFCKSKDFIFLLNWLLRHFDCEETVRSIES